MIRKYEENIFTTWVYFDQIIKNNIFYLSFIHINYKTSKHSKQLEVKY